MCFKVLQKIFKVFQSLFLCKFNKMFHSHPDPNKTIRIHITAEYCRWVGMGDQVMVAIYELVQSIQLCKSLRLELKGSL